MAIKPLVRFRAIYDLVLQLKFPKAWLGINMRYILKFIQQ